MKILNPLNSQIMNNNTCCICDCESHLEVCDDCRKIIRDVTGCTVHTQEDYEAVKEDTEPWQDKKIGKMIYEGIYY